MTETKRPSFWAKRIEKRFGGYKHQANQIDESLPRDLKAQRRVGIIGAGIAGLSAATRLAQRGFMVTIYEKNDYIGGKIGAWPVSFEDGFETHVEHGFHAFFRHYYNLRGWFEEIGIDRSYKEIDDYLIMTLDDRAFGFCHTETTPLLNLYSLAKEGLYDFWKVALSRTALHLMPLLRYTPARTFKQFDHMSFDEYAKAARLPENLKLIFNTFSRAFFAQTHLMSMAELIKSFHFFYLSNNHGLLYDYIEDDYGSAILDPIQQYLEARGVQFKLGHSVSQLTKTPEDSWIIDAEPFDHVIIASDIVGTRKLLKSAQGLHTQYPKFCAQIQQQKPSQRYAVLRLWLDRDIQREVTPFIITEREVLLDAIACYHQLESSSSDWAKQNGGGIFELHSYAVPDEVPEEEIRGHFLKEFHRFFPELKEATIHYEYLQVRQDFAAFHVGMHKDRPTTQTPIPGLYLAGDWVKLPYPAMLMEAACMAGFLCANHVLQNESVQEEPILTVPLKGFFA